LNYIFYNNNNNNRRTERSTESTKCHDSIEQEVRDATRTSNSAIRAEYVYLITAINSDTLSFFPSMVVYTDYLGFATLGCAGLIYLVNLHMGMI
jgi:hypothetical protein